MRSIALTAVCILLALPSAVGAATEAKPELVVQVGHAQTTKGGALSPDGRLAATGASDGLRLWHVASGRQLARFDGSESVAAVAFSPDGERVASAEQRKIRIYDVATRQLLQTLVDKPAEASGWGLSGEDEGPDNFVSVDFSPDGRELVSAGGSKLLVWRLEDGSIRQRIEGHAEWVSDVVFSADGRRLASGSDDDTVKLWDARDGRLLSTLAGHTDDVNAVAMSANDRLVASASDDKTVRVWDAASGRALATLTGHDASVTAVVFNKKGTELTTGGWDRTIRFWDVPSGQQRRSQPVEWAGVDWMAGHHDGGLLVGYTLFEKIAMLDAEGAPVTLFGSLGASVDGLAMSRDLRTIAVGAWQGVSLWDLSSGTRVQELGSHGTSTMAPHNPGLGEPGVIEAMAFSPDGSRLAVGDRDGEISVYSMNTRGAIHFEMDPAQAIEYPRSLAFSADGARLHGAGGDGVVRTWNAATGEPMGTIDFAKGESAEHLAVSPDGRHIALATDAATHLWSADGKAIWRREGEMDRVAFADRGSLLVAGDTSSGAVRVLSLTDPDQVKPTTFWHSTLEDLVVAPDGLWVATAGLDRTVRIWDSGTGALIRTLEGHPGYIKHLAVAGDGKILASGAADGTTRLWRVADGEHLATLVSFNDGRWAAVDGEGRFDTADLESVPGLHWVMPDDPFTPVPIEAFMRDYYEPRLVARRLAGETFKPLPPVGGLNRVQPEVRVVSVTPDAATPGAVIVELEVAPAAREMRRDGRRQRIGTGVYDLRLFRNGQLVGYRDGEVVAASGKPTRLRMPVRLSAGNGTGTARFSAYAFNVDRIKSATAALDFTVPESTAPRRPRAILASIGVDLYQNPAWDLEFATNDARLINDSLAQALRASGRFDEVLTRVLVSDIDTPDAATKAGIRSLLSSLSASTPTGADGALPAAGPDDVVIVTFSGHGALGPDGQFHLLGHDIGEGRSRLMTPDILARGISTDELGQWLRDVDAGELVLVIDACHAGATVDEAFKPGPMGSRGLGQLAFDKGMRILSATQADDVALESEATQQGLLSYALVNDGLRSGLADFQPADGRIVLPEWLRYAVQRVPGLSGEVYAGSVGTKGGDAPRVINSRGDQPPPPRGLQQPSLFDFRKGGSDTTLAVD